MGQAANTPDPGAIHKVCISAITYSYKCFFLNVFNGLKHSGVSCRDVLLQVLLRPQLVVCYKAKDFLRTALQCYQQEITWKQGRTHADTYTDDIHAVMNTALLNLLCCQWLGVVFRTHRCQAGCWILQILAHATRTSCRNTANCRVHQQPLALRR